MRAKLTPIRSCHSNGHIENAKVVNDDNDEVRQKVSRWGTGSGLAVGLGALRQQSWRSM
jgi:hypothetical protein